MNFNVNPFDPLDNLFFIEKFNDNKKIIDLSNLKPTNNEDSKDNNIMAKFERKNFYPMFLNPKDAVNKSSTKSMHLAVPGLMPSSPDHWEKYKPKNQIFYMPNDEKPHFHGDAPHHIAKFNINKVWLMSENKYVDSPNKQLEDYRNKKGIKDFNAGKHNTPVETWIHWRIPYDEEEYPKLILKKDSILWWDFNNMHNLKLFNNKDNEKNKKKYNQDNFENTIQISTDQEEKETLVTIMDKVGIFYFACTIVGHAKRGHKIVIEVIE
mgnify:CR=1 FL=1